MNERIKQLTEQANDYANHLDKIGVDDTWQNIFNQKFAELIVRECGQWVNDNLGLLDEEARADLLKYFGVEE